MASLDARNVNHPDYREPLNTEKYRHVRAAILHALAGVGHAGIEFAELEAAVDRFINDQGIPRTLFPKPGSVRWYTKAVQLDLEARELVERVPNARPMRLRPGAAYDAVDGRSADR